MLSRLTNTGTTRVGPREGRNSPVEETGRLDTHRGSSGSKWDSWVSSNSSESRPFSGVSCRARVVTGAEDDTYPVPLEDGLYPVESGPFRRFWNPYFFFQW